MSVIGSNILAGASAQGAGGGYTIDQSLRFNDDDSAHLSRTPASAGNRKTWTWSGWVKRGNLGRHLIFGRRQDSSNSAYVGFNSDNTLVLTGGMSGDKTIGTSALFRDPSAWYHIVFVLDTTQATNSNRFKIYVNGSQQSLSVITGDWPAQNFEPVINTAAAHGLGGQFDSGGEYSDFYLSEVHFIDGQALDPSYFGETDEDYGHWKPIAYTGSYGTNGFYLDFSNSASPGEDQAGSNDWTANNLAATDVVLDSPTNNFATWNAVDPHPSGFLMSEGNLKLVRSTASSDLEATINLPSSGKYYFEVNWLAVGTDTLIGLGEFKHQYRKDGKIYNNDTLLGTYTTYTTGDIISVAVDCDTDGVEFFKNGVSIHSFTSSVANADLSIFTYMTTGASQVVNFGQDSSFAGNKTAQNNTDDNGYGDFYYAPPSGFLALCTANLSDPAVVPGENFNTVLYTGNESTNVITGVGFQPDLVWAKGRNIGYDHALFNVISGTGKWLRSNQTGAEITTTDYANLTSFDTDGFTLGATTFTNVPNDTGYNYVAWNWKADNTSGSSNTDGSITSTVAANPDAGFSIVSYTGQSTSSETVGHGLSQAPQIIFVKSRGHSENWAVSTENLTGTNDGSLWLNLTNAETSISSWWGAAPSASVFTIGSSGEVNYSYDYIAYCFHSVDGFSKFGSYTGNGSSDGAFVYTGFRPAFVMVKRTDGADDWYIRDSVREPENPTDATIYADLSYAEDTSGGAAYYVDFLSNGFKLKGSGGGFNASGGTYIYMAFAEYPFKRTNAR
jgi:hypothetical protein